MNVLSIYRSILRPLLGTCSFLVLNLFLHKTPGTHQATTGERYTEHNFKLKLSTILPDRKKAKYMCVPAERKMVNLTDSIIYITPKIYYIYNLIIKRSLLPGQKSLYMKNAKLQMHNSVSKGRRRETYLMPLPDGKSRFLALRFLNETVQLLMNY